MTIKATVFKLLWTSLSDLKNKRNICSIKKIITMYRWIKVWINKKYLFSLLFQKNTYHTFSHQRALVSVMSVLSFFFSECQDRRHRVKFKWCHTPLLRSIYQSYFLFDLKLQFINGYSKHRNDWILSLKIRVAIPQSSVLNYCSDLIIFPCFSQAGGTSDNVSFAIMIPQIHFCYLNCHTDTFNQLLLLHVSRLRSYISYHLCPKCNKRMEFGFFKADIFRKLRVLILIISMHYKL